jgi:hypothetical protein
MFGLQLTRRSTTEDALADNTLTSSCLRTIGLRLCSLAAFTLASPCLRTMGLVFTLLLRLRSRGNARQRRFELLPTVIKL